MALLIKKVKEDAQTSCLAPACCDGKIALAEVAEIRFQVPSTHSGNMGDLAFVLELDECIMQVSDVLDSCSLHETALCDVLHRKTLERLVHSAC